MFVCESLSECGCNMQEAADASETGRCDEYVVAKNRDDALVKAESQYAHCDPLFACMGCLCTS